MTITLNQGQKKAVEAFFDFLMTDDTLFAISGPAGVGKTFLMGYIATDLMKLYEKSCALVEVKPDYDSVVFTATTNKAAEVLEETLSKPVATIHSFLGLKVKENYKTGKTTLERTKNFKVRRRLIVFIDEASMVDTPLFDEIMEAFEDCKIVFVGDHAQMAPVGENLSKVWTEVDPKNRVFLTEPVRNAGQPALMALCQQLRDTVETGIFKPIREVPGVVDYLDDTTMPLFLGTHFQEMNPSCRVLCYTNTRVQAYNEHVREEVRGLPLEPQTGDIIVVASAYSRGNASLSVERELEVCSVSEVMISDDFEELLGEVIPYREIGVIRPGGNPENAFVVPVAVNGERVNELGKALSRNRAWIDYFNLKNAFADLRDKAACTVYKSQGSTYDSVFVDLGNIGTSFDAEQLARMIFVAISRARSRVFLYGQLPGRFHDSGGNPLWKAKDMSILSSTSSSSERSELSMTV